MNNTDDYELKLLDPNELILTNRQLGYTRQIRTMQPPPTTEKGVFNWRHDPIKCTCDYVVEDGACRVESARRLGLKIWAKVFVNHLGCAEDQIENDEERRAEHVQAHNDNEALSYIEAF